MGSPQRPSPMLNEFPVLLSMLENDNRYTLLEGAQPMISSSKVEKLFFCVFFFGGPSLGAPWVSPRHRKSSRALRWRSCVRALRCNSLSHVSTVVSGLEVSVTTASLSRGCQMRDSHQVRWRLSVPVATEFRRRATIALRSPGAGLVHGVDIQSWWASQSSTAISWGLR
jgi:hypothetical protein